MQGNLSIILLRSYKIGILVRKVNKHLTPWSWSVILENNNSYIGEYNCNLEEDN